ncbi:hypothetical protein [Vibrio parahaemolyticus]|uniref:hypothetical protein n=1 Tax=Vibrio parahaemolyticus TaxID=670 RepID=UPI001CC7FEEE|nr:hypothetical protein [Vibrio parahaemolyticus]
MQMNNTTTQFNTTKEEVNTMHTEVNSTKENLTPLTESSPIKSKKQRGASLLDFIFGWAWPRLSSRGLPQWQARAKASSKSTTP